MTRTNFELSRRPILKGLAAALGLSPEFGLTCPSKASQRSTTLLEMAGVQQEKTVPSRTALIIIDAQNDYLDGALPLSNIVPAIAEIVRLRAFARRAGIKVIHVQHQMRPGTGLFGSERGARIVDSLTPEAEEQVVSKTLPNAFAATNLNETLHQAGRDRLILTGFMTHMCLDSTCRAALDLGYVSHIVAAATADRDLIDDRGETLKAEAVKHATLAALRDRFAWIVPNTASFEPNVQSP